MALIICPECGKEYSDKAPACPNCGCPTAIYKNTVEDQNTSSAETPNSKTNDEVNKSTAPPIKKRKSNFLIWIIFIGIAVGLGWNYLSTAVRYQDGIRALQSGNYALAYDKFNEFNYQQSNEYLNECNYLIALEKCATQEIKDSSKSSFNYFDVAEYQRKELSKYKNLDYVSSDFTEAVNSYYDALIKMINADLNGSFNYLQGEFIRFDLSRSYIFKYLYSNYGFMLDNKDFLEYYVDSIPEAEQFWEAYLTLEETGHIETKDANCATSYVELYYRNDSDLVSSQTFIFEFSNYRDTSYIDTVEITVDYVPANSEYKVRCNVPKDAMGGYTVRWSYYYDDIVI